MGRFLYTFNQYPINQLDVYYEMLKVTLKDKGASEFVRMLGREGGTSEKAEEFFNALPNKSKANVFNILLAIAIPIATLYALARNWNVAARAMPGFPRISSRPLVEAISAYTEDPTADNLDKLKGAVRSFFSITSKDKVEDAFNAYNYGMLKSRGTGQPLFVEEKDLGVAAGLLVFGRSSLEEYEKAYPSLLSKWIGGNKEASEVQKLTDERNQQRKKDTDSATEFIKSLKKDMNSEERMDFVKKMEDDGKLTEEARVKIRKYLKEQAQGTTSLDKRITGLNDKDQAQFVLDELKKATNGSEATKILIEFKSRGILTDNVRNEMRELLKNQVK